MSTHILNLELELLLRPLACPLAVALAAGLTEFLVARPLVP